MKLRQIKRWDNNEVIFELECENDKELVEAAVRGEVSLYRADLSGMLLADANMSYADMRSANMDSANMSFADMDSANMSSANMSSANMSYADMDSVNMDSAKLWGVIGNKKELRSMHIETYDIAFTKDFLQIGCEGYLTEEWRNFSDEDIHNMGSESLAFFTKWKKFIFEAIELSFPREATKKQED